MPSTQYYWRGDGAGAKSDLNDGRNWIDETGTAHIQADYPGSAANPEVIFDAAITAPALAPSTNMDMSGFTYPALAALRMGPLCNYAIGDPTHPLITTCPLVIIDAPNAGNIYLKGISGTAGISNLLLLDGPAIGKLLYLDGKITSPIFLKGKIDIADTCTIVTSCEFRYKANRSSDVIATIHAPDSAETLPNTVICSGGTITNERAIATELVLDGGDWTQNIGAIALVTQRGGLGHWNAGAITNIVGYGGEWNAEGGEIARVLGDAICYPGHTLNLNNPLGNVSVSGSIVTYGAQLLFTPGSEITVS